MRLRQIFPIFIGCLFYSAVFSQVDSIELELGELGLDDIREFDEDESGQKMISGGRFLQNRDDLPVTAFIITKEEILDNGYITLADVVKSLPGFRVSQPGSPQEGETFMVRGLVGNTYMKILLDDVPLKPTMVRGMPIGAQLPIRQAERIEVIYGPSGALYGADASAGVINIITKKSERPIYVKADLSVGTQGYSSIDVMFGGKLGQKNHILKYSLYGSNTVMNTRRIFYEEDELYNPSLYINNPNVDTAYVANPNYSGTAFNPTLGQTPHLSRLFGIDLNYKIITLSGHLMYRRDHSAVGLNPLAVSYANPNQYYGETIGKVNLNIANNYKKWGFRTNLNYIQFGTDVNSSTVYVENKLGRAINNLIRNIPSPAMRDSIRQLAYETYFSDVRYHYGGSIDMRMEQLFYIQPFKFLNLTVGGNAAISFGTLPLDYLPENYNGIRTYLNSLDSESLFYPEPFGRAEWYGFLQAQFNFEKFRATLGYQFSNLPYSIHLPQIALLYKFNNALNIRANYGRAERFPAPFYRGNTFKINLDEIKEIEKSNNDLFPEITDGAELGLRYKVVKKGRSVFSSDVAIYYTRTKNFISFNFDNENEIGEDEVEFIVGYFNEGNARTELYGIQADFEYSLNRYEIKPKMQLRLNYNLGKEQLPTGKGALDVVRGQPKFMGQFSLSFRLWKESIYVNFVNNYVSSHISTNVYSQNAYESLTDMFTNDAYYTLDFISRYKVSNNFQGYVKIKNVFNKKYAGIDATGTIDDLIYNPQSLRTITFGLSYRIE